MLNENTASNFTKRIEELEKELSQANNAKVKANAPTKAKHLLYEFLVSYYNIHCLDGFHIHNDSSIYCS